jgi:hypothetical protein
MATDGQSVIKSWCRAPSGAHDQIFITILQLGSCFLWGAISDERTGLSFVYAACPCQRSLSWVRVPCDSRPYFTVSDLRLPFSSPPTTRRVTVEVFDPASTQVWVTSAIWSASLPAVASGARSNGYWGCRGPCRLASSRFALAVDQKLVVVLEMRCGRLPPPKQH